MTSTLDQSQKSDKATQKRSGPSLIRKPIYWRDWIYTDDSLRKNGEGQDTFPGVHHPHVHHPHPIMLTREAWALLYSTPCAKLAAIPAAIIHGYSHIGTYSLTSLHQIIKQLSHPNLHRHPIQGNVLQSIANLPIPPLRPFFF